MLHHEGRALVVDPGAAPPVLASLHNLGLTLDAILVTHHHADHTAGVDTLRQATDAVVYGPALAQLAQPCHHLHDGAVVDWLDLQFEVLHVPGHTADHLAYFATMDTAAPILFCGDTLFSAGCGRLFEGTPEQMLDALTRLANLPDTTRVCCAHEYTLNSLRFARTVEPDNLALQNYQVHAQSLRDAHLPTLPSSIGLEKQLNPFLRTHLPSVVQTVQKFDASAHGSVPIFAALRRWRDQF